MGRAGSNDWPSAFHCFDKGQCSRDLPLCCYAVCCPQFAWSELMEVLDEPAQCCPNSSALNAFACVSTLASFQTAAAASPEPFLAVPALLLGPYVWQDSRRAIGNRGLPMTACCGPYTAHLCCGPCALYQELVYAKHTLRQDFTCCCYLKCTALVSDHWAFKPCGKAPKPGDYYGRIITTAEATMTAQPGL